VFAKHILSFKNVLLTQPVPVWSSFQFEHGLEEQTGMSAAHNRKCKNTKRILKSS
jgi:hypothetical protein